MSYISGVKSGLVLTAFIVALSPANYLLLRYAISPEFFLKAAQHAVQSGALTEPQAAAHFSLKTYIVAGIIGGAVTGTIFSAVVALFTRKTKKLNHEQLK